MPILHIQLAGEAKTADGSKVALAPNQALQLRGPVVQVSVGLDQSIANVLLQKGQSVPAPKNGWALIDTGASNTCIDDNAAQELKLPVVDVAKMHSASHADTEQNVYPIHVEMVSSSIQFSVARAIGAALAPQGLLLLLGRDVLQVCTLFYNGVTGQITLSL